MKKIIHLLGSLMFLLIFLCGQLQAQEMKPLGQEGTYNTLYGNGAGFSLPPEGGFYGNFNTFIGSAAGYFTTEGSLNTFIGYGSGFKNISGFGNVFLGNSAGEQSTGGSYNTFVGMNAGRVNDLGVSNTFIGSESGRLNTEGQFNTYLGVEAGHSNVTGSNNICIGYKAGYDEVGSNRLYINSAPRGAPLIYGEFDNRLVIVNGDLESDSHRVISDIRLKRDIQPLKSSLDRVLELRGVSYRWRTEEFPERGFKETGQIGLVAQEVEGVIPELVSTNSQGFKAVSYDKLTAVLVEAIKELRAENKCLKEQLSQKVREQQSQIDELRNLIQESPG